MRNYTEKVALLPCFPWLCKNVLLKEKGRNILVVVFFLISTLAAGQELTSKKISLTVRTVSLKEALQEIQKQSGITIVYGKEFDQYSSQKITIIENSISVKNAVDRVLKNTGLEQILVNDQIAIRPALQQKERQKQPGRLTGTVLDENGEGLPGASVRVVELNTGVHTDVNGAFNLALEPGVYTLEISFISYQTQRITSILIEEGKTITLDVVMKVSLNELNEVVITAEFSKASVEGLLKRQKNNAAISDGISAAQIQLTPDNNTAQVLKRVSGVTVQNEKFVTIRGLSDRYNNVLINGASAPSTEPNRRNFSFDIVPSALVDNIVVNKTASPDLPSEFSGGLVQITTKDVPDENFLQFSIGTGINTESSGKEFLSFKRDKYAYLGIVDENRKWFGDGKVFDPVKYQQARSANDTEYLKSVGAQIPNRWQGYRYAYSPMQNYQLAGGINKALKNGNTLGVVATANYRNEMLYEGGPLRVWAHVDAHNQRYNYATALGSLLNLSYVTPHHKFSWKNLFNHRYSNTYNVQPGQDAFNAIWLKRNGEVTLTNTLFQSRLEGEHALGKSKIRIGWYGDRTNLLRNQPDTRFLTGRFDQYVIGSPEEARAAGYFDVDTEAHTYIFTDPVVTNLGIHSSRLEETRNNAGLNVTVPFTFLQGKHLFKTGYALTNRNADFDGSNLLIQNGFNGSSYLDNSMGMPFYNITTEEAFRNGDLVYGVGYAKAGTTGDRYTGSQNLQSGYAMLDLNVLKKIRVTGGFRYEDNRMKLSTVFYNTLGYSTFDDSTYYERDWLPSANLIYNATSKLSFRAAASKTLARPDFVERSPYTYYEFSERTQVVGKRALKYTRINNYDFRMEYYPSPNEVISGSVFYKDFESPVERFYNIGVASNSIEFNNLHSATLKGFEVDVRKSLDFLGSAKWLGQLYISGNYTYQVGKINVEVTRSPVTGRDTLYLAKANRPIQGVSPYIINGGVTYMGDVWGFNIVYNRFGERIINGGGIPEVVQYENPRDVLDLQVSARFANRKLDARLNFSDILNQYFIIYSNSESWNPERTKEGKDPRGEKFNEGYDLVNYKVKKGTGISLIITYNF